MVQDDVDPQVNEEAEQRPVANGEMSDRNPLKTGGTVHFVVEEEIYQPACRAPIASSPGMNPKRVVFHKGDDESDAQHELETGLFAFTVGSTGWELVTVDSRDSHKSIARLSVGR